MQVRGDRRLSGYKGVRLETSEDVKKLVLTAMSHRVMHGTKCNENSSRSHCMAFINLLTLSKGKLIAPLYSETWLGLNERAKLNKANIQIIKLGLLIWLELKA